MTAKHFALVALIVLTAGPAGAQNREHLQMTADLRMLQEQIARLQLSVNQLTEEVKVVGKKVDAQAAATQKAFADQQVLINGIATTSNTIRTKIDANTVTVSQLVGEVRTVQQSLRLFTDQFNTLMTLLQSPVNPQDPNAPQNAASGGAGGVRMPESPLTMYNAAMDDYMKGDWENAVDGFGEFLGKFSDAPDAARAQFHIGLAYNAMKPPKYAEALAAFGKVISNYKDSPVVPDAYYEQGIIYADTQRRADARRIFELIIKEYPQTEAETLAKQKLQAMGVVRN